MSKEILPSEVDLEGTCVDVVEETECGDDVKVDDNEDIRLADESGSESCENVQTSRRHRSQSSSSENFTDARMDSPDNEDNYSSSCLPSIPSEFQLDSLPHENGEGSGGGVRELDSLQVSIAKIEEIEDFLTPEAEIKEFYGKPEVSEETNKRTSLEGSEEVSELCNSGSIHADLENLEDYGDERFVSDVGESIQVKNVEVDVVRSKREEDKRSGNSSVPPPPPIVAGDSNEEDDEEEDDMSDSSMINSIDRGTSSDSPQSPMHDGSGRRRNSSSLQTNIPPEGDLFPNDQIIDYLVDVTDDVKRYFFLKIVD